MEVEAAIESPIIFAGDQVKISVNFSPLHSGSEPPLVLLSGYALVQGSFKLGNMMLSEPFAESRKAGIVLTKTGFNYGQTQSSNSLFSGVLGGIKSLVSSSISNNPQMPDSPSTNGNSVSLGDQGYEEEFPIFATSQLLLFTDLELTEPQKFRFTVDLPADLPPTYRSRSLHIRYNLVVGFERISHGAHDSNPYDTRIFLPCRVLAKPPTLSSPIPPKFDLQKPCNAGPPKFVEEVNMNNLSDGGMNEFISDLINGQGGGNQHTNRPDIRNSIANVPGGQYSKVSYDINRNKVSIAQLVLGRPAIAVGDVLTAQVRFKRSCLHLSVYLELEELIEEPYAALGFSVSGDRVSNNSRHKSSNEHNESREENSNTSRNPDESPNLTEATNKPSESVEMTTTTYTIYARQFQSVYGLEELPIYLPTLTTVTPRLDTKQISAGWSLRLDFVGLVGTAFSEEEDGLLAKGQVEHESFSCRIPISVLPPVICGKPISKKWRF